MKRCDECHLQFEPRADFDYNCPACWFKARLPSRSERRCATRTVEGFRCKGRVVEGYSFCLYHLKAGYAIFELAVESARHRLLVETLREAGVHLPQETTE